MKLLTALAEFVQSPDLAKQPCARIDQVKRHFVDTVGVILAGTQAREGVAVGRVAARKGKLGSEFLESGMRAAVLVNCAAARATELDDIHLNSCTTPGAVIVPTAIALRSAGFLQSWREFCAAVIAGYELLIRLGFAADGPAILRKKVWPTYLAAALGSAATASRAYGLGVRETAGALGTALAFSVGTSIPSQSLDTSRWLALGVATTGGILAATSAQSGLLSPPDLLETCGAKIAGVRVSQRRLLNQLGSAYLFDDTGMKPYPIARQALAAIEACREIARAERLTTSQIKEIVIAVPEAQRWLIDRPEPPRNRMASIMSAQYQAALVFLSPKELDQLRGDPGTLDNRLLKWMGKVRVSRAPDLEKYYPDAWPSRVKVRTTARQFSYQLIHPRGDAKNPLTWQEISRKFLRYVQPRYSRNWSNRFLQQVRHLEVTDRTPDWDLSPSFGQ